MKNEHFIKLILPLLIFGLLLGGCNESGIVDEELNNLYGTVEQLEEEQLVPREGVNVTLEGEVEQETVTGEDGSFSFENIPDGTYDLVFESDDYNIIDSIQIGIFGGTDHFEDYFFNENGELISEDELDLEGLTFATNIRDHTLDMTELGQNQMEVVEDSSEILAESAEGVGHRLAKVSYKFEIWSYLLNEYDLQPGEFNYDMSADEPREEIEEDLDDLENIQDDDYWTWIININREENWENEKIVITLTNPFEIYKEIEEPEEDYYQEFEIDLTEGYFDFQYLTDGAPNIDWNFNFTLESENDDEVEIIEPVETDDDEEAEEKVTIIYPLDPEFNLDGYLVDNLEEEFEEDYFSSSGILETVNLTLDIDLEAGYLEYEGLISTPVLEQNGSTDVYFENFTEFIETPDEELPVINEINVYDSFEVYDYFRVTGETQILFTQIEVNDESEYEEVSIPYEYDYNGSYEDLTENEGFIYNGNLNFTLDYDKYAFDEVTSEDNYIKASLEIGAILSNTGFGKVDSQLVVDREEYEVYEVSFDYNYEDYKYISGAGSYDGEDFEFEASNELNQTIIVDYQEEDDKVKIGELLSSDNEKLATIYYDEEVYFEFEDGTIVPVN